MTLLSETRGRIRILTLNRPDKRNALNLALCEALVAALREADEDASVAAVVLAGAGPGFSAGADLSERKLFAEEPAMQTRRAKASLDMLAAPGLMGKPVVAATQGATVGAGSTLALCCDLVVAAEDVRISYPEAKHDIYPSLVMPTLLRHLGPKDCFDLLATGRVVLAEEALRLRLANQVVPRPGLLEAACALAESAALYGADSMRKVKAAIAAMGQGLVPSAP
jgi:enoyl-CoA hydratase/carnithine racemase